MAAKYNNSEMQRPGKTMAGKNNGRGKPRHWGGESSQAQLN
jgi:hypothetical protein